MESRSSWPSHFGKFTWGKEKPEFVAQPDRPWSYQAQNAEAGRR